MNNVIRVLFRMQSYNVGIIYFPGDVHKLHLSMIRYLVNAKLRIAENSVSYPQKGTDFSLRSK